MAEHAVKTSVIIPVYNTEDYLEACVESVLAQTQEEIEVILVDDGSTDNSLAIERSFAARDQRVRVIEQPNLRQGTARNTGLKVARGEFVYFMDSDDLIKPTLFETCYEAAQQEDLDFVIFDSLGFVDDPEVACSERFSEICDRTEMGLSGRLLNGPEFWTENFNRGSMLFVCWLHYIRRSFIVQNGLTFVEGIYFEDNDWILRLYLSAHAFRYLPLFLHRYRERSGSNVHSGFKQVLAESCFDVHFILIDLLKGEADPVRRRMVLDVLNLNLKRFDQFRELSSNTPFEAMTQEFCNRLAYAAEASSGDDEVSLLHLQALHHVKRGCSSWERLNVPDVRGRIAERVLRGCPLLFADRRVGIYGTGKLCTCLLELVDISDRDVVFVQTERPEKGSTFKGKPLVGIEDAPSYGLGAMVIASTKYRDPMLEATFANLGEHIETFCLPRSLLMVGE